MAVKSDLESLVLGALKDGSLHGYGILKLIKDEGDLVKAGEGQLYPVLGQGWTLNYEMFFYAVFTACLDALDAGARSAHLLDGRIPHVLLLELFTDTGVGTMVTSS